MDTTVAHGKSALGEWSRHASLLPNLARVIIALVWTVAIGTPLIVVIYVRYWYGLLQAKLGRSDDLDRAIEANAILTGRVTQDYWANVLLALLDVPVYPSAEVPVDWSRAHVICSNHASVLDILALIRVVPPPFRFVAKRELTRWPIVGWALRPAGQIIIDRKDREQAIQSISEAAARHIRGQVIFFVEGTRSRSGDLQPFKKGAFHFAVRNDLPVLPVAIRGSYTALAKQPWWRLRSGCPIDVRFCAPIRRFPSKGSTEIDTAVESLRSVTRLAIREALGARDLARARPSRNPIRATLDVSGRWGLTRSVFSAARANEERGKASSLGRATATSSDCQPSLRQTRRR